MLATTFLTGLLVLATIPFIYYLLAVYSSVKFVWISRHAGMPDGSFIPGVSCLKPIKGLDIEAYENYASFCRQDYPKYEIVFCVDPDDPALPLLEKLMRDFPTCDIRLIFGPVSDAVNDKVARLERLTREAKYDLFVITDGDVRVRPDYLKTVIAAFRDPQLGAATCLYKATRERTFLEALQSISMTSDFFAGVLVAWNLDGVKFTLSQSILTTRKNIDAFGGYSVLEDRPADDLYIGRFASENGFKTALIPYTVESVADFHSLREFLFKRVRWMTVMRHMRPWGHFGLFFTWGLPWALAAVAAHPTAAIALGYLGGYLLCRIVITWIIGTLAMKQSGIWRRIPLIPLWDLLAFGIWLASFTQRTIRWRGVDYFLREGQLSPVAPGAISSSSR